MTARVTDQVFSRIASIYGRVTDRYTTAAVAGAEITLLRGAIPPFVPVTDALTDRQGLYHFDALPKADYRVRARAPRFRLAGPGAAHNAEAAVAYDPATGPERAHLPLRPETVVAGRVLDAADRTALAGAEVELGGTGIVAPPAAATDARGIFRFSDREAEIFQFDLIVPPAPVERSVDVRARRSGGAWSPVVTVVVRPGVGFRRLEFLV